MAEPIGRAAVLGRPIAHSLSPLLHRAAYAALALPWSYEAIECGEGDLAAVLAARRDWAGFSCTMPLKRVALALADEVRADAAAAGAANTLLPRAGGGWIADNTDVTGIVETVRASGGALATATILGAGGTAQACVVALARLGVGRCVVLVRDPARAREVTIAGATAGVAVEVDVLSETSPALAADLVVSTLPGGASDRLAGRAWHRGQAVLDVVYDPWPTALARGAAERGARALSGASMLLHQAAAQVTLMTGRVAPVGAMRAALRTALPAAGV